MFKEHDKVMVMRWKEEIDTLLVFVSYLVSLELDVAYR